MTDRPPAGDDDVPAGPEAPEVPEVEMHPWRRPGGGPPISARTALLMVAVVFALGVAVGFLLGRTA